MTRWRWLLAAGICVAVLAFWALNLSQYLSLQALQQHHHRWAALYAEHPWTARGVYFALYFAVACLSLPGAALLTLAGGAVFGFAWGLVMVSFASCMGATVSFWMARGLLRDWVEARFATQVREVNAGIERAGALYLLSLRLIPVVPFFLVNISMGLTNLRSWTFYWVSQLGMLLGTAVYVNAGIQLGTLRSLSDAASPAVLGSLALVGLLPLVVRRVMRHGQRLSVLRPWRRTRPRRFDYNVLVIGAGPCGVAAANVAAALRAKVGLVDASPDCSGIAAGVERLQGYPRLVDPWTVDITRSDDSTQRLHTCSMVIASAGHAGEPALPGLEVLGLPTTAPLATDDTLQTAYPPIYAAGDAIGPLYRAVPAEQQGWYAAVNALFGDFKRLRLPLNPQAPQAAPASAPRPPLRHARLLAWLERFFVWRRG